MSQNVTGILKICMLVLILTLSAGMYGIILGESQATRADGAENWNYKVTSISPVNPTADDFVTFTLEVNNDDNITKVQIFICRNNICGVPKQLSSTEENVYTYKHTEKFDEGTKVDYRFMVTYDNTTDPEKIPYSSKTENVASVQGSLYFEFFMGENWNFDSVSIEPAAPKGTDPVTFTFTVTDDSNIDKVLIEVVQIKPLFSQELPVEMAHPSANTYTFERGTPFDAEAQIGYRFHIEYTGEETLEVVPIDSGTENTVEEQEELYFTFTVEKASDPDGNGDKDKDDDGGLPGFSAVIGIISIIIILLIFNFTRRNQKN